MENLYIGTYFPATICEELKIKIRFVRRNPGDSPNNMLRQYHVPTLCLRSELELLSLGFFFKISIQGEQL